MEWRPVVGWEERYEVSDTGAVRTKTRAVRCLPPNGVPAFRIIPGNLLAFSMGGHNRAYRRVMLHGAGRRYHAYVHHLVAEAWHGKRPEGTLVCHRDDCSTNNTPGNLYYGTRIENENDRAINSLIEDGADQGAAVELAGCDW